MEENIITIRKKNIAEAHQEFVNLMSRTESLMNEDAKNNPNKYQKCNSSDIETYSVEIIKKACNNSPFSADEVNLISGYKFPDIIANKYYGIEVKSTKSDHWVSTGSSIVESRRDINVEDIYMIFGKIGGDNPQFRCRPYEDVLYDIAVTHSPRYLINMDIEKSDTIFSKMGTTYDMFRKSDDLIDQVRKYFREKATKNQKTEMPWWITAENAEETKPFNVKLWNSLKKDEQKDLKAKCMILFPEALNPKRNNSKYNQTSLWLCTYNQVVMPNIRDLYSAGGKIITVNGQKLKQPVAQVFCQIVQYAPKIKEMLDNPSSDLLLLIKDYNPDLLKSTNLYDGWLNNCILYAKPFNIPLEKWIKEETVFTFSK